MTKFIESFFKGQRLPAKGLIFQSLPGDGSRRLFWRITPSRSDHRFIAMENAPSTPFYRRENEAYLYIGQHLFQKGLPVPEIHRSDLKNGWFIMEDMGAESLQDMVSEYRSRISLYEKVLEILFRLQMEGSMGFKTEWCCQTQRYDFTVMRRYESDYFRDSFLFHYLGLKEDWPELEGPFDHLAETASRAETHFFLHRDFQSRNIMVEEGRIGIIDWQGGRLGPLQYDLASLLLDPYTGLDTEERRHLFEYYLKLLRDYQPGWVDLFRRYFPYLAIQRNLQILGAFSYLSKVRKKPYFEAYIAPALRSLRRLVDELNDPKLLPLMDLLNALSHLK